MSSATQRLGVLFTGKNREKLVLAIVGSILAALAEAVGVLSMLPLMQTLTGSGESTIAHWVSEHTGHPGTSTLIIYLALLVFGTFFLKGVATICFRWWMFGFVLDQEAETSVRLLGRYLAVPYHLHLRKNSAELIRTMNDAVSQTYSYFVIGLLSVVSEGMTIVSVLVSLVILMPLPATIVAVYFLVTGVLFQRLVRRHASSAGERMLAALSGVYTTAMHALGAIKEIKVRHNSAHFVGRFREFRVEVAQARRVSMFVGELPKYVFETLFIMGVGLLAGVVFATEPANIALSMLAIFVAGGFRVLPSMVRLMAALNMMRIGNRGLDMVLTDLQGTSPETESHPPESEAGAAPLDIVEGIRLESVSFRHVGTDHDVVKDVDISIPAGTSVALVGPSGAGKSTIVDLLLGLHQPRAGRICIDGNDASDDLRRWQRSLGTVPQEVFLLDDSLTANIVFGPPLPDHEERLHEAVTKAQLQELVLGLPEGLETKVGERGARLSGGQRQRIGIARALYRRPKVLILDEATSALDNETERRINETIASLHGEMTIIVVAHRLSTVKDCDQLVFLKDGRVNANGTFSEVYEDSEDFAAMAALATIVAPS